MRRSVVNVVFLVGATMSAAVLWWFLYKAHAVTGDELRAVIHSTDGNSADSWWLVEETSDAYTFQVKHAVGTQARFKVAKSQVELAPALQLHALPANVREGDIVLRANRYPGASEERL